MKHKKHMLLTFKLCLIRFHIKWDQTPGAHGKPNWSRFLSSLPVYPSQPFCVLSVPKVRFNSGQTSIEILGTIPHSA